MERIVVEGLGRLPQFAHAARIGQLLFVSGTLGTTEGFTLADGIVAQTEQTLTNMATILEADGADWDDVAKVNVFLADMADAPAMNTAYSTFFGDRLPPARITVGGCALALDARVEMDCIAERRAPDAPHGTGGNTGGRNIGGRALPSRRTLRIQHGGEELYVEVVGEEHRRRATPLVLSHGAGGNHAVWFQQVAHFATERMVVTWDHRGFGNSPDRAGARGPAVAADDLLAVYGALGIERADLVGQSMGGWSVVGAAISRPTLARSLVLADTLGGITSATIERAQATLDAEPPGVDGSTLGLHPAIDPSLAERDAGLAHLYQSIGGFGSTDVRSVIGRLLASSRTADEAAEIGCPVLCVVGDRDPLFAPPAVRALADILPNARVAEIPGSGHSPYFEDALAWNTIVERFLYTLDR
jgi:3-oxoadipate enol-lactonase